MKREITQRTPIFDHIGNVINYGYSKNFLYEYDKNKVKYKRRLKEWNFYQLSNEQYCLQLNIGHIYYISSVSVVLIELTTGKRYSISKMKLFNSQRIDLSNELKIEYKDKNFELSFEINDNNRKLQFKGKTKTINEFSGTVLMKSIKDQESITILKPFKKENYFYLNQKINCFKAEVSIHIKTKKEEINKEEKMYGLLDLGRGVWPYSNMWYWANGSKELPDGRMFGFNFGYGFGNDSYGTENALFLDGKQYKIDEIKINYNKENIYEDWTFLSSNLELKMQVMFNNHTDTNLLFARMQTNQLFGVFSGFVIINNEKIKIDELHAFCEECHNRW